MPAALSFLVIQALAVFGAAGTSCPEWLDPPIAAPGLTPPPVAVVPGPAALPPAGDAASSPAPGLLYVGTNERSTYDVRYGLLGRVGELTLSATLPTPAGQRGQAASPSLAAAGAEGSAAVVAIRADGSGQVLGLGRFQRTIDTEFDLHRRASSRWRSTRRSIGLRSDEIVSDSVVRQPGDRLSIERRKWLANTAAAPVARTSPSPPAPLQSPSPTEVEILGSAGATSDPLGLIWRLRNEPPAPGRAVTLQMLDGMALWRVEVRAPLGGPVPVPGTTLLGTELDATLTPIRYDGQRDPARPDRRLRLWLATDGGRIPLRLEMPIGLGDAVLTLRESRAPGGSSRGP
jgi:hypothetical protein